MNYQTPCIFYIESFTIRIYIKTKPIGMSRIRIPVLLVSSHWNFYLTLAFALETFIRLAMEIITSAKKQNKHFLSLYSRIYFAIIPFVRSKNSLFYYRFPVDENFSRRDGGLRYAERHW